jgi:hypothetical protein
MTASSDNLVVLSRQQTAVFEVESGVVNRPFRNHLADFACTLFYEVPTLKTDLSHACGLNWMPE